MEEQAPTPGGAPVVIVTAGRGQVWRPLQNAALVAVPLAAASVAGVVLVPEPASARVEVWVGLAALLALACLVVGLLPTAAWLLGSGRHRVVDTGTGLRLVRWWGTHETEWSDVRRVDVEDGSAAWTWTPRNALPRVVVLDRAGRRWRVPFVAFGGDLALQRQRLAAACAAHGVEVRGAALGSGERRRALGDGQR